MANRLADETSPYLLQHKDNPVDWYPWGEEALGARARGGPADPALDRLLGLPLVPRDGARVLRGRGDGRAHERALRLRQARPRGAPRPRRDLHGGLPGDDRPRRLAAQRLPHARAGAVLRRHLLPARARGRACRAGATVLEAVAEAWDDAPRGDPRRRRAGSRERLRGRRALRALERADRPARRSTRRSPALRAQLRPRARRLRRRAEVPARLGDRVPAAARRDRDGRRTRCARWPRAACTTRSAAASPATRSTPAGSSPTSRRCSTTTRCSPAPTCTAGR